MRTIYAKDLQSGMVLRRERERIKKVEVGERWVWVTTHNRNRLSWGKYALIVVETD